MKKTWIYLPMLALVLLASSAFAQGGDAGSGCDSSPENPTVILALAGSLGAAGAALRNRVALRRAKKSSNETAL